MSIDETTGEIIDTGNYQIMPPLSGNEYESLKAQIAKDGVLVPVEYDEDGNILDGFHRVKACKELNIKNWPSLTRIGLTETEKRTHARIINIARRHLNREQKRELVRAQLLDTPEWSNNRIAQAVGLNHKTVIVIRKEMEQNEQLGKFPSLTGADGKQRPAEMPEAKLSPQTEMGGLFTYTETKRKRAAKDIEKLRDEAPTLLKDVQQGNLTISQAKRKHAREQDEQRILALKPITGKFRTILIDPPWNYGSLSLAGRAAPQYAVMGDEELLALPVPGWADEQCHLYLWTTNNFLGRALALIESWGFAYKTLITWIKPSFGLGSYFRNSTEHCLFAIKNKLTTRVKNIPTHFEANRQGHSIKPDMIYTIAERASYPPRLEVFARQERDEWERAFHE